MSFSPYTVNKNLTLNLSFVEKQEEETIVTLSEQPSLLLAPPQKTAKFIQLSTVEETV